MRLTRFIKLSTSNKGVTHSLIAPNERLTKVTEFLDFNSSYTFSFFVWYETHKVHQNFVTFVNFSSGAKREC